MRLQARLIACFGALLLVCVAIPSSQGQGCTQCRDNAAATPLETQHAYRDGILLLGGVGITLGSSVLLIGRRFR